MDSHSFAYGEAASTTLVLERSERGGRPLQVLPPLLDC